jgi:hypothetical protein
LVTACEQEDAGSVVVFSAPVAGQRLPAAPFAVPWVPGRMGGLRILLGLQLLEEQPPFPGNAARPPLNFQFGFSLHMLLQVSFASLIAALLLLNYGMFRWTGVVF